MNARKRLLIVYHSQTGHTGALARAALAGARTLAGVDAELCWALDTGPRAVLDCDALLLATPENFGTMSGGLKDFFDRIYYPCEGKNRGLPYALLISAGNDGRGAEREIRRIATGLGWRPAQEALIVRGEVQKDDLERARELGEALATGLELGIF